MAATEYGPFIRIHGIQRGSRSTLYFNPGPLRQKRVRKTSKASYILCVRDLQILWC
ncbi:hypothetical protein ACJIZ3_015458 [Penstemon smallii]|uniref:Uncharacterized protein n=1 Tax=Penstemon smallii TaxID=265156 RepID=A0ABD3RMJ3_9LAMI